MLNEKWAQVTATMKVKQEFYEQMEENNGIMALKKSDQQRINNSSDDPDCQHPLWYLLGVEKDVWEHKEELYCKCVACGQLYSGRISEIDTQRLIYKNNGLGNLDKVRISYRQVASIYQDYLEKYFSLKKQNEDRFNSRVISKVLIKELNK